MKAVVSSAKPFLSFLFCLVICTNHFSHSLSTSHALHKRMTDVSEAIISGAGGGKSLIGETTSTFQKGTGRISKETLEPPIPSDGPINPELARTIGGKEPVGRPSFTSDPKLWGNWVVETLKRKFSEIIQKIKTFVGLRQFAKLSEASTVSLNPLIQKDYAYLYELVQKSESRFRKEDISENLLLLHPGLRKQYEGLSKLVEEDESLIDGKIDAFIRGIQKDHPDSQSSDPVSDEQKVAELKKSVHELRKIYLEDQQVLQISDKSTSELLKTIPRFLGREVDGLDALQMYGKRMSIYQSHFLAQDKKALQKWLPKHQRYLSKSYSIMGPHEVLRPWLRKLIKQDDRFKSLGFSGKENEFLGILEFIQYILADLAYMVHETGHFQTELIDGAVVKEKYEEILQEIDENEKELINILGGDRDKVKQALKMITKTNFHKEFMAEFMTPRSLTGYKMQLLVPYGILRNYNPKMEPLYKELGLPSPGQVQFLQEEFKKYLILLAEDVEKTWDVYFKRENQEKILMEILTPEGLQLLGNHLKNSEKVSPLE